jgi:hypothetical protein
MEALKIIATCLLAGSVYGILHDQVTTRVCLEYFTVFHPDVFHTQSPTLLAFGWGILATWWASLFVGLALAMAARLGSRPRFSAIELVPKVALLMAAMALFALIAGASGYFLQGFGMEYYATNIPKQIRHPFYADLWAHTASYLGGFLGGLMLCVSVWRSRGKRQVLRLTAYNSR